jgi:hypothetical protein
MLDIPEDMSFQYRDTCWKRYLGLCKHHNREMITKLRSVSAALYSMCAENEWVKLSTQGQDPEHGQVWYGYAAMLRASRPKVMVLCTADLQADKLTMSIKGGKFDFMTSAALARRLFQEGSLVNVLATRVVTADIHNEFATVRVVSEDDPVQIFSTVPHKSAKEDEAVKSAKVDAPDARHDMFEQCVFGGGGGGGDVAARSTSGRGEPGGKPDGKPVGEPVDDEAEPLSDGWCSDVQQRVPGFSPPPCPYMDAFHG